MENKYCEDIRQQILTRAYFIWQYRMDNNLLYTTDDTGELRLQNSEDDYFEALDEITGNLNLRK